MNIALIIAGGRGMRMGQEIPKQFLTVADKPVIAYTLEAFQKHPDVDAIAVVCVEGWDSILAAYARQYGITKLKHIIPGGANGLTLLIQSIFDRYLHITIPYTAINVLLNAIPVYIGFRFIGKKFTLCSCLVIFLTGFLTDSLPAYTITSDILLISIFGGLINGFAISLCLKCDATTGGTDFISIFLSRGKGINCMVKNTAKKTHGLS